MKKISAVLLAFVCIFLTNTSSIAFATENNAAENISVPVYYEEPDWSSENLPEDFIVINTVESNSLARLYIEDLTISFNQFVSYSGARTNYNQKYKTYTFVNGYTYSTRYTLVATDVTGKLYSATVSYDFY